jgi:hypothetical protein
VRAAGVDRARRLRDEAPESRHGRRSGGTGRQDSEAHGGGLAHVMVAAARVRGRDNRAEQHDGAEHRCPPPPPPQHCSNATKHARKSLQAVGRLSVDRLAVATRLGGARPAGERGGDALRNYPGEMTRSVAVTRPG